MFEDSTFESTGRIHTHSRGWMLATSAFNGTILIALVLIPLIYPRALPQIMSRFMMEAPSAPVVIDKPVVRVERTSLVRTEMSGGHIFAPTSIPRDPYYADKPEALPPMNVASLDDGSGTNAADLLSDQRQHPVVREAARGPVRISEWWSRGCCCTRRFLPIRQSPRQAEHRAPWCCRQRSRAMELSRICTWPADRSCCNRRRWTRCGRGVTGLTC